MFGTLGALFGPVKYGMLPDQLKREELPSGNALIEGGTFLAILLGTIFAGVAANGNSNPIHFAWLMLVTALVSWLASLLIPKTGEGAPGLAINRNILGSTGISSRNCAPIPGRGGRPGGELVLARRAGRHVVAVAAGGVDMAEPRPSSPCS